MKRSFIIYYLWSSSMVVVHGLWPLCLLDVDAFDGGGVAAFHSRMNRNFAPYLADQCDKLFQRSVFRIGLGLAVVAPAAGNLGVFGLEAFGLAVSLRCLG
jgi:hypothetical protein